MKTRSILFGLSVCAAMCACTDNDVTGTGSEQQIFTSNKAYMVVNIQDVGSTGSRAIDGGFESGSAAEHAVLDAHFYFYDENGNYYAEGREWNGGDAYDDNTNIEFKSKTVIVVSGLTNKDIPSYSYVVTVLNKPAGFEPAKGSTLDDMKTMLASQSEVGITKDVDGTTYFAMSTTSYVGGSSDYDKNRKSSDYYFVTKVNNTDFYTEPIPDVSTIDDDDVVVIYVERLAAKVTLKIDDDLAKTRDHGRYEIKYTTHGTDGTAKQSYYVSLDGWALNGIAKKSYIVKQIDDDWENTAESLGTSWNWNDPTNFRSYWGMSPNYGKGESTDYPTSSEGNTDEDEAGASALNEWLTYVSLENAKEIGDDDYCGENTNTVAVLGNEHSTAITNILVKATIYGSAEGEEGLDLVRYDGVLYTFDDYCAYILNELQNDDALNVWYKVSDSPEEYAQINTDYVEVADNVDGYIKIALKSEEDLESAELETTTFYKEEDGGVYTPIERDDVQDVLDEFNENQGLEANGYKGGAMYYNIPIEHLNPNNSGALQEAEYGIVRNHHYVVTITELAGLGRGIFDPDEVIIPQDETDKYYLASQINILSWKLVEQSVEL